MKYTIEKLDHYGRGIVREDVPIFVEDALPNEIVKIKVIKDKKCFCEAEIVDIIKENLSSSTGDVLSNLYIIPLVRCNEKISCPLDNVSYNRCLHWFAEDVRKYQFKDILLLGNAARRFLNCTISNYLNTLFISKNNKRYAVNYAPSISFIDSNKFDTFKENLIKWYNSVINEDFSNYEIIKL